MKDVIRNKVFCELPVILQIINDYWKTRDDSEASIDDFIKIQHWFLLLSKYSELVIDIGESDFVELAKTNPIYKQLLKNSVSGGSKIINWERHQVDFETDNRFEDFPTAIFLLNRSESYCNQKINDYGLIFLNGENYKSFTEKLFLLTDIQVKTNKMRSDIHSWSDIKRLAHPINSLILTDNYILKDKTDIASNLIPLLDSLLPDKLDNCKFQLMIITQLTEELMFTGRYSEILQQINSLNRKYAIELSLISCLVGSIHDRRIFTNYCMFESNNSFTYFNIKGNVKKNTTLHAFPSFMIASGQELMQNKNLNTLSEIKEIVENHAINYKGPASQPSNRLLDQIST